MSTDQNLKKMFWYYFICDKAKFEMSTSTVELQETFTSEEIGLQALDPKFLEPKPPVLLVASMWLFQSIFSACKMEFTGNLQGGSSIIHFFLFWIYCFCRHFRFVQHAGRGTYCFYCVDASQRLSHCKSIKLTTLERYWIQFLL